MSTKLRNGWDRLPPDPAWTEFEAVWREQFGEAELPTRWGKGNLYALVAREPTGVGGAPRWHVSVSTPNRLPKWGEVVEAAHSLRPGVPFVMGVPPQSWWMNVHPHTLHLWECFDQELIEQWRANATGQAPT